MAFLRLPELFEFGQVEPSQTDGICATDLNLVKLITQTYTLH
jgi:hypothetical protein